MAVTKTKQKEDLEQTTWPEAPEAPGDSTPTSEPTALTAYELSAKLAADEGRPFQAFDQRNGKLITGGGIPTPEQRRAELRAVEEETERQVLAFIAAVRLAVGV